MNVQAEISLYPLRSPNLSEPINKFCETLMKSGLSVKIGRMSTTLSGELASVFDGLKSAMAEIAQDHEVVFVVKVSNACPADSASEQGEKRPFRGRKCAPRLDAGRANFMRKE